MTKPVQDLHSFQPTRDFFVGLDSDGCIFDSVEIKHKECFAPQFIRHFNLQPVSKYAREAWEFVNLYSQGRGSHRFPALIKTIQFLGNRKQVKDRNVPMPNLSALEDWLRRETRFNTPALNAEVARGNTSLAPIKAWNDDVNRSIAEMVHGLSPFPLVRESLTRMRSSANVMCLTQIPAEGLKREWAAHQLDKLVEQITGQELGTKTEQLRAATQSKYLPDRVLMIGDSPGDFKAAKANNALFFPINPGREEESWKRLLHEGLDRFFDGTFAGDYEAMLVMDFDARLPERPTW